jgi:hypothetical protein
LTYVSFHYPPDNIHPDFLDLKWRTLWSSRNCCVVVGAHFKHETSALDYWIE